MYGEKKDFSDFRAFGCRAQAWVYLDKQRREKGKNTPKAKEAIYVGFTDNMSAWTFYIPEDRKIMNSNQVKFSEHEFPFQNRKMIDQFLSDNSTDILYQHASYVKWEPYNKLHVANFERVHYDTKSAVVVLKIKSKENPFTRAIQGKWLNDKIAVGKVSDMEVKTPMYAFNAEVMHRSLKGLDPRINPDKPLRNFGDA